MSQLEEINVGDRVFFYESSNGDNPDRGYGMILELVDMRESEKYRDEAIQCFSTKQAQIAVILTDGSGQIEEHLLTNCLKVEAW